MMTSSDIRQKFLDYFRSKQHQIVPSAPIVLKNDPTLLFTNAGMNQFKDYFLGNRKSPYPRIADTQKCLRVSGKHNDLEEVGVDTYHHTMFEMLGNWSFGDYFKNEAIAFSWELLTDVYHIPKERIYATVFEGDPKENLPASSVALAKWKEYLPEDHIVFGNKKDNFWEMGDTGPCGPCSEIHVDLRSDEEISETAGRDLINKDHPQVIEIWNNVFIQYNRLKDGSLEPLPSTHVDTGMGLERLVRVIQNKTSNYDTDLFTGTISYTEQITGKCYEGGHTKKDIAFRVIADHIRAICFTIADGQMPSNTGAGYVIRRILRRAVRYYFSYLDYKQPLLTTLVPVLATQFENVFSELKQQQDFVQKVIREEEEAFLRTLDKGLRKIDEIISGTQKNKEKLIDGKAAFELYDTYGFPLDLTRLIAAEENLEVDEKAFSAEMQQQKNRSRAATSIDAGDWIAVDANGQGSFVGYHMNETSASVLKYRTVKSKGKEAYQVVLDKTPFYAESGGQVGDTGSLEFESGRVEVVDTKKENDLIIHYTSSLPPQPEGQVRASIDLERRNRIAMHHSATHLLHAALRQVLGVHVTQKGSLVNDRYLRFDFSHFSKMSAEEIRSVEKLVNEKIRQNIPVLIREMPKDEALALGAMALFGEKYGDLVRVVVIDPAYSVELCGGTHVTSTGMLGVFRITHETAVAAGVRRIEAICGEAAESYMWDNLELISALRETLKNPKDLAAAVQALATENTALKKRIGEYEQKELELQKQSLKQLFEDINGISFLGQQVQAANADNLKQLALQLKEGLSEYVILLAAAIGGKSFVALLISDNLIQSKGLDASKIIREKIAPLIGGGGGGQKSLATAGGQDSSRINEVIDAVRGMI